MPLTVPMQTAGNRPAGGYSITATAKSPGVGATKPFVGGVPTNVRARRAGRRAPTATANPTYLSGTRRVIVPNTGVSLGLMNGSSV